MMWYGDHMNGWGYAFMGLSNLLFWALLIVGGIALFRYLTRAPGPGGPNPSHSGTSLCQATGRREVSVSRSRVR
jgi:putative membrane protein